MKGKKSNRERQLIKKERTQLRRQLRHLVGAGQRKWAFAESGSLRRGLPFLFRCILGDHISNYFNYKTRKN